MTESRPRILAVTTHRPQELAAPLRHVELPVEVVEIDPTTGFVQRNVATITRTRRAIRDHDPDVVLYDCRELMGTLVTLVSFMYGVSTVFRFKGNHWRGLAESYRSAENNRYRGLPRYYLSHLVNWINYSMSCGFVVVSAELQRVVADRTGRPPEQVQVVHVPLADDWADGDASAVRESLGIDAETVFVTVTNLDYRAKYDGVQTIVRGVEPVLRDHQDVAYVVAGDGPYHDDLVRFLDRSIDDASVRDRILTPGFVDPIEDLYELAAGFVYVSHIDGYPNVVLEAQRAGLPVVANAAHGMVEQIDDGETGHLLESATPAAVEEHVRRLLVDPEERRRLGENARQRVLAENTPEVIGRDLEEALRRITQACTEPRTSSTTPSTEP